MIIIGVKNIRMQQKTTPERPFDDCTLDTDFFSSIDDGDRLVQPFCLLLFVLNIFDKKRIEILVFNKYLPF